MSASASQELDPDRSRQVIHKIEQDRRMAYERQVKELEVNESKRPAHRFSYAEESER